MDAVVPRADRIRAINDHCRATFTGAAIVVTAAFDALAAETKAKALERVRTFNNFNEGNNPWNEHDMGFFEIESERFFWAFSYYDKSMKCGSDDPSNTDITRRVLTIGLASDY